MKRHLAVLTLSTGLSVFGSSAFAQAGCSTDTTGTKPDPFAFADFTWLNGNARTTDSPISTSYFNGEFRVDIAYIGDFNHPKDHTLVGRSESGRTNEVVVQQLGIGGDFDCGPVAGRL